MSPRRKVVLIVDDETGMREALSLYLRHAGYAPRLARDGREALALMAESAVDLVVTDLTMPRLDGFELLKALVREPGNIPTIVITGFATVEMATFAMRLGAADFLLKPFDLAHLTRRIGELTG